MKKIISTTKAPSAIGPYSQAVLVDKTLYISGQIPLNPETNEMEQGIENETHQVLKNIKEILKSCEMDFSNIVKTTIFLKNLEHFGLINEIYSSYFSSDQFPARETVEVSQLPKNAQIEISIIAHQF